MGGERREREGQRGLFHEVRKREGRGGGGGGRDRKGLKVA